MAEVLSEQHYSRAANLARLGGRCLQVETATRSWITRQADIVIAVRKWNHSRILGREYIASRLAVFEGGADFEQELKMLWAEESETDFRSTTKMVVRDFREVVEKLGQQKKGE